MPIAGTQRVDQRGHVSIPLHATAALDGLEDSRGHPPEHHLPATPTFHVALHQPCAADEALGRSRRGERAAQARRARQREDGERFIEAVADALGGPGLLGLEPAREIEQQSLRSLHVGP